MKRLPNEGGRLIEEPDYFGERAFLREVLERFPQLADDPVVEMGIHLSMAALGRLTLSALRQGDVNGASAAVEFLAGILANPRLHPEIRNAISISFLEPRDLATFQAGRDFWDAMPPSVRQLLG